jgi:hypothetical protein
MLFTFDVEISRFQRFYIKAQENNLSALENSVVHLEV